MRLLEKRDLQDLVTLCKEHCAYERATWQELDQISRLEDTFIDSESAWCWVVESDGGLVGYATASTELSTWHAQRYLHLDCLFLQEAHRGQGLGRRLMRRVAATAVEHQAINLQWQTPSWNTSAVGFYDSLGAQATPKLRFTLLPEHYRRLARGSSGPV